MYLVDTNVISELRKKAQADPGVKKFFSDTVAQQESVHISVITVGELRRGIELIRHRGDTAQANKLDTWLQTLLDHYAEHILDFTQVEAQVWGRLRVPHYENALDKQIAATALTYGLTLVTRNTGDFAVTGVSLLNPFERV
jgi:predicted nucleic acid-binding protein